MVDFANPVVISVTVTVGFVLLVIVLLVLYFIRLYYVYPTLNPTMQVDPESSETLNRRGNPESSETLNQRGNPKSSENPKEDIKAPSSERPIPPAIPPVFRKPLGYERNGPSSDKPGVPPSKKPSAPNPNKPAGKPPTLHRAPPLNRPPPQHKPQRPTVVPITYEEEIQQLNYDFEKKRNDLLKQKNISFDSDLGDENIEWKNIEAYGYSIKFIDRDYEFKLGLIEKKWHPFDKSTKKQDDSFERPELEDFKKMIKRVPPQDFMEIWKKMLYYQLQPNYPFPEQEIQGNIDHLKDFLAKREDTIAKLALRMINVITKPPAT